MNKVLDLSKFYDPNYRMKIRKMWRNMTPIEIAKKEKVPVALIMWAIRKGSNL